KSEYDIPTNILTNLSNAPQEYSLSQNYPNPFNPATMIEFSIPSESYIKLKVYDIMGREVSILAQGIHNEGIYRTAFDGSAMASGIYIYKIETENFNLSKKMILMK